MNSYFYHIQTNIKFSENKQFYKDLMEFLGWEMIFETDEVFGYKSKVSGDIWFVDSDRERKQDYDDLGVNHISIRVDEQDNVNEITAMLKSKGIETLFGTPQHRADFAADENSTYYQIMFKTSDNILFEIVYIGPKALD